MTKLQEDDFFPNSIQLDPELVAQNCGTRLPVRVSKYADACVEAIEKFHKYWKANGGKAFHGCFGGSGFDLIALGLPECLPERIQDIMDYSEFYFTIDDLFVDHDTNEVQQINNAISQMLPGDLAGSGGATQWSTTRRQMLSEVSINMIERDRARAYPLLKASQRFAKYHNVRKDVDAMTWDEWCKARWEDGSCYGFLTAIVYCCALDLTQEDIDKLLPITWPGMMATALTNDYYSFEAEVHTELEDGALYSAVWRLMKTLDITIGEAKKILFEDKIKGLETQFIEAKEGYLTAHLEAPRDVRRYLAYVELMVSGNWYWGAYCPRYHQWSDFARSGRRQVVENDPAAYDETTAKCDTFITIKKVQSNGASKPEPAVGNGNVNGKTNGTADEIKLSHETILAPIEYMRSLPSKNVRTMMINALDVWCNIHPSALTRVESIVSYLHDASLMLDDIEDGSPLRRGHPSAHSVFGTSQTINSANYLYTLALGQAINLPCPESLRVFSEELRNLYLGQSWELKWTHTRCCPTIPEYKVMVQHKTGGLFRMLGGILYSEGQPGSISKLDLMDLMTMMGEYFQTRDDYSNLHSADYHAQKGFCEDLDEGKFSLPLIHLLEHTKRRPLFESMLSEVGGAHRGRPMTLQMKKLVYDEMEHVGSLDFTKERLVQMEAKVLEQIELLERQAGAKNYIFRLILDMLRVEES